MGTYENHILKKTAEHIRETGHLLSRTKENIEEIKRIRASYLEIDDDSGLYKKGVDACDEIISQLEERLIALNDQVDEKIRKLRADLSKQSKGYIN